MEVLKEDESAEEEVLRGILTGKTFQGMKIENLVERDFFYWIGLTYTFKRFFLLCDVYSASFGDITLVMYERTSSRASIKSSSTRTPAMS